MTNNMKYAVLVLTLIATPVIAEDASGPPHRFAAGLMWADEHCGMTLSEAAKNVVVYLKLSDPKNFTATVDRTYRELAAHVKSSSKSQVCRAIKDHMETQEGSDKYFK